MLDPIFISATTLSDAWFQTIYKCVEKGRQFVIDRGSFEGQKRLEFDYVTIHIKNPSGELLPSLNPALQIPDPVASDYLDGYLPYLMTGEEHPGEAYTYGQRINKVNCEDIHWNVSDVFTIDEYPHMEQQIVWGEPVNDDSNIESFMSQLELMIWTYKNKGHRNNQMIMQVGQPSDMLLKDPPCLRHIDTRIQDGKLHFFPYFRSWDLWGGMPANLAAIEMMKQYCASEIGVENGEIIASSKGLHLYNYTWELCEIIRGKTMEEFRNELTLQK